GSRSEAVRTRPAGDRRAPAPRGGSGGGARHHRRTAMSDGTWDRVYRVVTRDLPPHIARDVTPESDLEALGFDSLARSELAAAVEEEFGLIFDSGDAPRTPGDLLEMVDRSHAP